MEDMQKIVEVLRRGGTMLYPTDTLWGLGCDATSEEAVQRIFALKQRADAKSLIALVDGEDMLRRYVRQVPPAAWEVVRCAAAPQTVIYPHGVGFARGVCAEDGSVAVRIPCHDFCREVVRRLGRPVVSTSANLSGSPAPATLAEVPDAIRRAVDVQVGVAHEGQPTRRPSSIIKLEVDGRVVVIR